jgi:LacI family transcriptional regulator
MESPATISDVASAAGVSTMSVSRYLTGRRVQRATEIERAIRDLGYRPSAAARSLRSGLTGSIGLVVPDVTNHFFAAVVKGAESVSRGLGYTILLCNTDESAEREHEVLDALHGKVDGLILVPATEQAESTVDLRRTGVPIVFLDRDLRSNEAGFDVVLVDNAGGGRKAAEYLLALGHRAIGEIAGPLDTTPGRGRHEGFIEALAEAGVEIGAQHVQVGDFSKESGYRATLRLLATSPPPTAVFVANNHMAIGALRALHALGVSIPAELSVISFDDLELAEVLTPPLTVIARQMQEQGALATRLLADRLAGSRGPAQRIVMDTHLLIRGSCGVGPARQAHRPRRASKTNRQNSTPKSHQYVKTPRGDHK